MPTLRREHDAATNAKRGALHGALGRFACGSRRQEPYAGGEMKAVVMGRRRAVVFSGQGVDAFERCFASAAWSADRGGRGTNGIR
jgi:hypothetical protein